MKKQFKPLVTAVCLTGLGVSSAFAAVPQTTGEGDTQLSQIQSEVSGLKQEVSSLKRQLHKSQQMQPIVPPVSSANSVTTHVESTQNPQTTNASASTSPTMYAGWKKFASSQEYLPFDLDVPGQSFVSSGPYIGVPIQFAGSDLIVNSPSVNTDVQLLGIRKNIIKQLTALGGEQFENPTHSHILLSGIVESQVDYYNNSMPANGGAPSSNIDVTNVSLDTFILGPGDWLLGYVELTYDDVPPIYSVYTSPSYYTVYNSRIYVNKAFVTIGDLLRSPFYGTIGQYYVPFGTYSTIMVSDPLTKLLGRTKARAITLGFQPQGDNVIYAATYLFRGDSHVGSIDHINNGGLNLGYRFNVKCWSFSGDVGGGVIGNLADSGGMQIGTGFDDDEELSHRVPAYNLRGNFNVGSHIDLIGEWITASRHFSAQDMSFNDHGAKPSAFDLEGAYSFYAWDKPSSLGLGYNKSYQAEAMGIPLNRSFVVINTSLWRNTLQSLEFRRDREYAASHVANGPTTFSPPSSGPCTGGSCTQTGEYDKAVTFQFDYYF